MSAFCTIRSEILFSIFSVRSPGVPRSTMKALISPSEVSRAQRMRWSAMVPLPIQRLAPEMLQVSPWRVALVVIEREMSDPWSGSVRAKAPMRERSRSPGSSRSRCSCEPSRSIAAVTSSECTPRKVDTDISTRESSRWRKPRRRWLPPEAGMPMRSSPARVGSSSKGKVAASQCAPITGRTSRSKIAVASLRRCCSDTVSKPR